MNNYLSDFPATICLLVLNIVLSLLAFSNRSVANYLALAPFKMFARREFHQIITSGFIHANMAHLLVNMITFYSFGCGLEAYTHEATGGRGAFLFIYVFSLITGSLYPLYKYRRNPAYVGVGASGAISGVVFSYCLIDPMATFRVFFAIPMPAIVFALLYVGYSIYAMRRVDDNIGHEAHLAGALGGIVATFIAAPGIVWFLR